MASLEEMNTIARKFLELKKIALNGDAEDKKVFKAYQNFCAKKMNPLVNCQTSKYKKFSNYGDLKQDAFEALMLALETYNPEKGDFVWWATKYIHTRVCRAANTHSTIRVPLKKAKKIPPYKVNSLPTIIDSGNSPLERAEFSQENAFIEDAINGLPEKQKQIILKHYEFGDGNCSIISISKEMKMSRPACMKLLKEAEESLKTKLQPHFE